MKRLALLIALAGLTASAVAAPETYVIDATQTSTRFSYRYLGVNNQSHRFEKVRGTVVFDRAAGLASADVVIDASSLQGGGLFNDRIQTADFFDSDRYPTITFHAGPAAFDGATSTLTGELTIKGVTRPVSFTIGRLECATDALTRTETCGAEASGSIRRSEFNMPKYRLLVSDDIQLNLSLRAVRENSRLQVASRDVLH